MLKWAGGKRQLLPQLLRALPEKFNQYIEPMVGGGALFFALAPERAVIADSNPELINFYQVLVRDMPGLIRAAGQWPPVEETYYQVRALRYEALDPVTAAARLLYLNRTCFNGLYRVNRQGQFNVPWGRYNSPRIIDRAALEAARRCLARACIELGDYKQILRAHAAEGDLIFLDPPYVPLSVFADFRRYTPQQFYHDDHQGMKAVVDEMRARGCTILITNSNHPLMAELYGAFPMDVISTRRSINIKGDRRRGQDVIIRVPPR